jgi:ubiquinone biosynthesis protein
MLDPSLTPSRLIDPATRPPLLIIEPERPSAFRNLQVLWGVMRLSFLLLMLKLRHPGQAQASGARLRQLLEEMGGLWFKVGQLLSLRLDILPVEVCRELGKLQYQGIGFPGDIARQELERELNGPIEETFSEFVTKPFAAASIGQVHRAKLRIENEWVAVKIQRPFVAQLYLRDLRFIHLLASILRTLGIYPHMRWTEFVHELDQMMREELDYHFEASSMRRMRKRLKKHGIYVPKVYGRYTTNSVLVTEFIHAVLMADYIVLAEKDPALVAAWLYDNNVDPFRIARRLVRSMWRQLFEDNLYHGDLHPGNIVLLRDSRVAMIDFGSTNFTERGLLEKFRLLVEALSYEDYGKAADLSFLMSSALPPIDTEIAKEKLVRLLKGWAARTHVAALPYHERSIDSAAVIVLKVLVEHHCTMEWAWLRVRRAIGTLDASLIYLHPRLNHLKVSRQYFRRATARRLRRMMGPQFAVRSFQSVTTAMELQDQLHEYLEYQSGIIRREALVFQAASSKFSYASSVVMGWLSILVLTHGLLLVLALVQRRYPREMEAVLGGQMRAALAGVMQQFDSQAIALIALLEGYVFAKLRSLRKWLRAKDTRPHGR